LLKGVPATKVVPSGVVISAMNVARSQGTGGTVGVDVWVMAVAVDEGTNNVGVTDGVLVMVGVFVIVGVNVPVGVIVMVGVRVWVKVGVGVNVAVFVTVGVNVGVKICGL
jgi:hypothetical protein